MARSPLLLTCGLRAGASGSLGGGAASKTIRQAAPRMRARSSTRARKPAISRAAPRVLLSRHARVGARGSGARRRARACGREGGREGGTEGERERGRGKGRDKERGRERERGERQRERVERQRSGGGLRERVLRSLHRFVCVVCACVFVSYMYWPLHCTPDLQRRLV